MSKAKFEKQSLKPKDFRMRWGYIMIFSHSGRLGEPISFLACSWNQSFTKVLALSSCRSGMLG